MSTRVTASARLSAACWQQLREQFSLPLDPAPELGRLGAFMEEGQASLSDLVGLIRSPSASSVLGALAPGEFAGVSALLAGGGHVKDPLALAQLAQAGLADAVAAAGARLTLGARDLVAGAFAESGRELGYTVSACRAESATGLEMRREHEVVLVRVEDGGEVEFDHAGLFDAACGNRQAQIEAGATRRGVGLTRRNQDFHGAPGGGQLIAEAGASGDPSLARATALAAASRAPGRSAGGTAAGARAVGGRRRSRARRRGSAA